MEPAPTCNVVAAPPPSSILRIKAVMQRTGLTRPTLYRKIADGSFPRQVRISVNGVGWRASEVDAWLKDPMAYRVVPSG